MSLVIALLVIAQPPVAVATFTQEVALVAEGDNAPALNTFLASLPAGVKVTVPAGVWPVSSRLKFHKPLTLEGAGGGATFKLIAQDGGDGKVAEIGHSSDPGAVKVDGVTVRRITFEVAGTPTGAHFSCLDVWGDDFVIEDCTFIGSTAEGFTGKGIRHTVNRCKAIDCGQGNAFDGRKLAGFNDCSDMTTYTDCEAVNCGQGVEFGGHGSKLIRCTFRSNVRNYGANLGSMVYGTSNLHVLNCQFINCGITVGNGIGRLYNITIKDNVLDDGFIAFMGGRADNMAENQPGQSVGQSYIDRNTIIVRTDSGGVAGVSTGPSAPNPASDEMCRESVTFNDNVFLYMAPTVANAIPLFVGGKWTGAIEWKRNRIFGLNAAANHGDLATFSYADNAAIPGQPGLTKEGNLAFKADGTLRATVIKIEGSP
jgi:hypothetical protein